MAGLKYDFYFSFISEMKLLERMNVKLAHKF